MALDLRNDAGRGKRTAHFSSPFLGIEPYANRDGIRGREASRRAYPVT